MKIKIFSYLILFTFVSTSIFAQDPPERMYHTMNNIGEKIYMFGGENDDNWLNDLWEISVDALTENVSTKLLLPTGDIPAPTYQHSAVVYNNELYLINGRTNTPTNIPPPALKLYKYTPTANQWTLLTYDEDSAPREMYAHSSQVIGDKLYISCKNEMWEFEFSSSSWKRLTDSPYYEATKWNFQWHNTAVFDNKFYVLRGGKESDGYVYIYNPITDSWSEIDPPADGIMPDNVWGAASWFDGDYFYSFDGRIAPSNSVASKSSINPNITADAPGNSTLPVAFNFTSQKWIKMELNSIIESMYSSAVTPLVRIQKTVYRTGGRNKTGTIRKYGEKISYELEEDEDKVLLKTYPSPPQAAQDGCMTFPQEETYPIGAMALASASPSDGWVFKEWTGDASGPLLEAQILMDGDKEAVGNFQPILELTLSSPSADYHCPPTDNAEELHIATAGIFVDGVDWMLTGITFNAFGESKADYITPYVKVSGKEYRAAFVTDKNNYITNVVVALNEIIKEGTTLQVQLFYKISLPDVSADIEFKVALNEVKKMGVSTNITNLSCLPIPKEANPGVKSPLKEQYSSVQTMANIWRISVYDAPVPFSTIKEAIDNPLTQNGHTIEICEGYYSYKKAIVIDKELTILGTGDKTKTIINNEAEFTFYIQENSTTLENLTLTNCCTLSDDLVSDKAVISILGLLGRELSNITIQNNTIQHSNDAYSILTRVYDGLEKPDYNYFNINIINNKFENTNQDNYNSSIKIKRTKNLNFSENTLSILKYGLSLRECGKSKITKNTIKNCPYSIQTEKCEKIDIKLNSIETETEITIKESNGIDIKENSIKKNAEFSIERSNGVDIVNNQLEANLLISGYSHKKSEISENILISHSASLNIHLVDTDQLIIKNNKNLIVDLIRTENTKLFGNECVWINLNECSKTYIQNDNQITLSPSSGITLNNCYYTYIEGNYISENKIHGIFSKGSNHNFIRNNNITNNGYTGISIFGGIAYGYISEISRNVISNHKDSFGIYFFENDRSRTKIFLNKVFNANKGIYLQNVKKALIYKNDLQNNCTGISLSLFCSDITVRSNKVENSWCLWTGIHLDNSQALLENNHLLNNSGAAVGLWNNSSAEILGNNFIDNPDLAIYNETGSVVSNAENNYWGDTSDPSSSIFEGDISVTNWLSKPISLTVEALEDTIQIPAGNIDSTIITVANYIDRNDNIELSISDEKEWLLNGGMQNLSISDSSFAIFDLKFQVPADAESSFNNKVMISAISASDSVTTVVDSFYIMNYTPELAAYRIFPDSLTIATSDSIQLTTYAFDQFEKDYIEEYSVTWSASSGKIDSTGLFIAPSEESVVTIEVTEPSSGIKSSTQISVLTNPNLPESIIITPDSITVNAESIIQFFATGLDKNGFNISVQCEWSTDGGTIDSNGILTVIDQPGLYTVTAKDTASGVEAVAYVTVEAITDIEENIEVIPTEYSLYQNYPNPFNPTTVVSYQLPVNSLVNLHIYNVLGQCVATLAYNKSISAGTYKENWNASSLSSGVYFMVMEAKAISSDKEFHSVKKMLLLK